MIKKFITAWLLIMTIAILPFGIVQANDKTTIKVEDVIAGESTTVKVPVRLTNNTGICGATLSVAYSSDLELIDIERGDALSTLTMTKPGKFTANPITLLWDGLESDASNGTIAILTFNVPARAGIYDIVIKYDTGDIVDGELKPIDAEIEQGAIKVVSSKLYVKSVFSKEIGAAVETKMILCNSNDEAENVTVVAAGYDVDGRVLEINSLKTVIMADSENDINLNIPLNKALTAVKVFVWDGLDIMKPRVESEEIYTKFTERYSNEKCYIMCVSDNSMDQLSAILSYYADDKVIYRADFMSEANLFDNIEDISYFDKGKNDSAVLLVDVGAEVPEEFTNIYNCEYMEEMVTKNYKADVYLLTK